MEDQTDDRRRKYLVEMMEFLSDNDGGKTLNEVASRRFLFNCESYCAICKGAEEVIQYLHCFSQSDINPQRAHI